MKPSWPSVCLFLLLSSVTARSRSFFGQQDILRTDDDRSLDVPGQSPLKYCPGTTDEILVIEHVNLVPNPPAAGKNLTIEAAGVLKQDVDEGAYAIVEVKWGLIKLIHKRIDLCEQVENLDMECPVKKGETALTKVVELPSEIPPGKYTVTADVYTNIGKRITCLTAEVVFNL